MYAMIMMIIANGGMYLWYMYDQWAVINVHFKSHVQYLSIGIHFSHFYCIGKRFGAFSPRVEIVIWELFGRESYSLYKLNHDAYDILKIPPTYYLHLFINSSDFGIIWEAISDNYLGGIGAQFTSKDS